MKKVLVLGITMLAVVTTLFVSCSGTPKAPVSTLANLDKLVKNDMTVDAVKALVTTSLLDTSVLYQASNAEQNTSGAWVVSSKTGGYQTGETGAYQVLLFKPAKTGGSYYAVFFKAGASIGKSSFNSQYGATIEMLLKGTMTSDTTTN